MMVASEITCHEPENAAFAILRNGARAPFRTIIRDINEDARDGRPIDQRGKCVEARLALGLCRKLKCPDRSS